MVRAGTQNNLPWLKVSCVRSHNLIRRVKSMTLIVSRIMQGMYTRDRESWEPSYISAHHNVIFNSFCIFKICLFPLLIITNTVLGEMIFCNLHFLMKFYVNFHMFFDHVYFFLYELFLAVLFYSIFCN